MRLPLTVTDEAGEELVADDEFDLARDRNQHPQPAPAGAPVVGAAGWEEPIWPPPS